MHVGSRETMHTPAPAGMSSILIEEAALSALIAGAAAGTQITYHVGHLAHDRLPMSQVLDPTACRALSAVANRAMRFADVGWVHLVQRRLAPNCWAYILIVRPRTNDRRRAQGGSAPSSVH